MTEGEAAPAAAAEPGARNLLMRVAAALVLAPAALAIAYAGGWLWTSLVTLAAIGLYVEWLMIVGAARERRVVAAGGVALAIAGLCLSAGWIDASPAIARRALSQSDGSVGSGVAYMTSEKERARYEAIFAREGFSRAELLA